MRIPAPRGICEVMAALNGFLPRTVADSGGVLSLGILERVEDLLRERHGSDQNFRLCHYFDLTAGTSTGAIIAAALAQDWRVGELREKYFSLGERVFEKSLFRKGFLRAKYDEQLLTAELQDLLGVDSDVTAIRNYLDVNSHWNRPPIPLLGQDDRAREALPGRSISKPRCIRAEQ